MSALVLVSILSLASSFVNSNFFEKSSGTFSGCSGCCFCFIIYHCLVHLVLFVSLSCTRCTRKVSTTKLKRSMCVCMSMVTLCTDCERAHSNGKTKPDTQKRVRRNHHAPEMVQMYTYTAENEQKTRQDEMKRST